MRWLADENISGQAIQFLRDAGFEVLSVAEQQPGVPDEKVIAWAREQQAILLSFDRDHGDLIFQHKVVPPPAVVYLRLHPPDPDTLRVLLGNILSAGTDGLIGHLTVVTLDGLRRRPLPSR